MCTLPLTHISAYSLSIEPNTVFSQKKLSLPDEDTERRMYWQIVDTLSEKGFIQYEISNFARAGYEAIHNTLYWTGAPYIGLGAGAHSFFGNVRYANVSDIGRYIEASNPITEFTYIDATARKEETYMLGLRLMRGIPQTENPRIQELSENGLIWRKNGYIGLTRRGMDIANYVICRLCE